MGRTKRWLNIFLIPLVMVTLNGCVYLVVGGVGAVGGYMVSPDSVEGLTDNEIELVWDAAQEVISIMGVVLEADQAGGIIHAKVNGSRVTITMSALNNTTVRLKVKARKAYLPKSSIAQDIFVKIMSSLN